MSNAECPKYYAPKGRVLYYLTPAEERVIKKYRAERKKPVSFDPLFRWAVRRQIAAGGTVDDFTVVWRLSLEGMRMTPHALDKHEALLTKFRHLRHDQRRAKVRGYLARITK